MAYTYLTITNKVLNRFNEVELSSSGFTSARGFQVQCKNAVNDALLFINQKEFNWPFNHNTETVTLVAGTTRYSIPATAKHVDYSTFRISKDSALGTSGHSLSILDYKDYMEKFIEQEDDATVQGAIPTHVVRSLDNNYLLYPYPDQAYELKFEWYSNTTVLAAATDVPNVPEQFESVITDGATAYCYQYRGEEIQHNINFKRFLAGIKTMRTQLLNHYDYVRSTVRTQQSRSNSSTS